MRIDVLDEPELEFGADRHVDIRFGISNFGPFDVTSDTAPRSIHIGIVGTPQTVEGTREWLERCRDEIPAKTSRQPNLFPKFPGFRPDVSFRSSLVLDTQLCRTISPSLFEALKGGDSNTFVREAVAVFYADVKYLADNTSAQVLLCAVPESLVDLMDPDTRATSSGTAEHSLDFHDLLKARCMQLGKPIQLILPSTYDPSARRKQRIRKDRIRTLQDEATRAWNLHTALYYKARGLPWRILRDPGKFTTCFIGVSFYRSLDHLRLMTSMAQVFDERGDGMVIRGAPVELSKDDRTPHLSTSDAFTLVTTALNTYREVHGTQPARIVVHKSSSFSPPELEGCMQAAQAAKLARADWLSVSAGAEPRLFRNGDYPPLRGTFLSLDERTHLLYTRGSVDFYCTYPGLYVPRPVLFRCDRVEETPKYLAGEMLALTKMNWNMSQFDGWAPITVEAARNVGHILRYVGENEAIAPHYSFYM